MTKSVENHLLDLRQNTVPILTKIAILFLVFIVKNLEDDFHTLSLSKHDENTGPYLSRKHKCPQLDSKYHNMIQFKVNLDSGKSDK